LGQQTASLPSQDAPTTPGAFFCLFQHQMIINDRILLKTDKFLETTWLEDTGLGDPERAPAGSGRSPIAPTPARAAVAVTHNGLPRSNGWTAANKKARLH
jgi:hypothetical protein